MAGRNGKNREGNGLVGLSTTLEVEVARKFENLAKRLGIPKSQIMRQLILRQTGDLPRDILIGSELLELVEGAKT